MNYLVPATWFTVSKNLEWHISGVYISVVYILPRFSLTHIQVYITAIRSAIMYITGMYITHIYRCHIYRYNVYHNHIIISQYYKSLDSLHIYNSHTSGILHIYITFIHCGGQVAQW